MKKLLAIIVLSLLWCNPVLAKGSECDLEVDSGTRSKYGYVKFETYNPTSKQILVSGVKYFKSDGKLWREFRDIREFVNYKRSKTITHYVKIPYNDFSYILICK